MHDTQGVSFVQHEEIDWVPAGKRPVDDSLGDGGPPLHHLVRSQRAGFRLRRFGPLGLIGAFFRGPERAERRPSKTSVRSGCPSPIVFDMHDTQGVSFVQHEEIDWVPVGKRPVDDSLSDGGPPLHDLVRSQRAGFRLRRFGPLGLCDLRLPLEMLTAVQVGLRPSKALQRSRVAKLAIPCANWWPRHDAPRNQLRRHWPWCRAGSQAAAAPGLAPHQALGVEFASQVFSHDAVVEHRALLAQFAP